MLRFQNTCQCSTPSLPTSEVALSSVCTHAHTQTISLSLSLSLSSPGHYKQHQAKPRVGVETESQFPGWVEL